MALSVLGKGLNKRPAGALCGLQTALMGQSGVKVWQKNEKKCSQEDEHPPYGKNHFEHEDLAVSRLRRPTHVAGQQLSLVSHD